MNKSTEEAKAWIRSEEGQKAMKEARRKAALAIKALAEPSEYPCRCSHK